MIECIIDYSSSRLFDFYHPKTASALHIARRRTKNSSIRRSDNTANENVFHLPRVFAVRPQDFSKKKKKRSVSAWGPYTFIGYMYMYILYTLKERPGKKRDVLMCLYCHPFSPFKAKQKPNILFACLLLWSSRSFIPPRFCFFSSVGERNYLVSPRSFFSGET